MCTEKAIVDAVLCSGVCSYFIILLFVCDQLIVCDVLFNSISKLYSEENNELRILSRAKACAA